MSKQHKDTPFPCLDAWPGPSWIAVTLADARQRNVTKSPPLLFRKPQLQSLGVRGRGLSPCRNECLGNVARLSAGCLVENHVMLQYQRHQQVDATFMIHVCLRWAALCNCKELVRNRQLITCFDVIFNCPRLSVSTAPDLHTAAGN